MYLSDKCGRSFASNRDLDYHINCRKTSCKPATHHCLIYSKDFSSYKSLWNHKQRCQRRKNDQIFIGTKNNSKKLDSLIKDKIYFAIPSLEDEKVSFHALPKTFSRPLNTEDESDDTAKHLQKRYKKLHYQFLHGQHELIHELTNMLDDILQNVFLTKEDYGIGINNLEKCL